MFTRLPSQGAESAYAAKMRVSARRSVGRVVFGKVTDHLLFHVVGHPLECVKWSMCGVVVRQLKNHM